MAAIGMVDKQIGEELGLSVHTLRTYWDRIRTKIGDLSRSALVAMYVTEQVRGAGEGFIVQNEGDGWSLDPDTKLVRAANAINERHGLEPGESYPLETYLQLIHPQERGRARELIHSVSEGQLPVVQIVFRNMLKDGYETVQMVVFSDRSSDGKIRRVYGMRVHVHDLRPGSGPSLKFGSYYRNYPSLDLHIDEELAALLGRPGTTVLHAGDVDSILPVEDIALAERTARRAIEDGTKSLTMDLRFKMPKGEFKWMRVWRKFETQPDGSVIIRGVVVVPD